MSINEFVEITILLCLICFSIYDKMQGFIDESGLFIYFLAFYAEIQEILSRSVSEINALLCLTQKFKMAAKSGGKTFFFAK